MSEYTVGRLEPATWDAFADLVERNGGIFGGCWCIGWHPECGQRGVDYREVKRERVLTNRAHAALVFDEHGKAQGWCQYGSVELFEDHGFERVRQVGKHAWILNKVVEPA